MKKFICTLLFLATSWVTGWAADKLPSLCDEWNIVVPPFTATDPFHTYTQYLESDTIISGKLYVKLLQEDIYKGALREESNATIYYIPSGSTHDYLLYAFNAKEGDVLDNIWTGGNEGDFPNGKSAVVQSITQTTPRQFVLSSTDEKSENTLFFRWIEGIGMEGGAVGQDFPLGMPIDPSPELLCAYKNGEQIYVSEKGEKYGCDYRKPLEVSITQASTWYGIRYVHDYPQKEYTPLITNLTYSLGSDTVIDGKLYRQIRYTHEYEHITNAYRGAIRQSEDGQQVYYIPWGSNNEYLLYNFDVKQGDIVHAYAGFNDISCEEMAEPGRSIIPAWTVMSVQTIDGRKHIFVQDEEYGTTIEWIEGIGTQYILWPFGRTCYATGLEVQFHHALCAADNEGNILYSFNTDDLGIRNECPNWQPMAIEHIHSDSPSAVKTFHNNQILILRGEKTYTLTGQQLK